MSSGGIETRGQAQARELIRHLGSKRGHVSQETWDRIISWDQDAHKEIYSAVVGLMELLEPTICTLAKNLYTSNAQFVFELLQNAEDNHYTRARLQGQVPYVAFKMYADRIVIECNEDGFAEDNIRAICAVGQSSKTGAQGYVGEKGIGFKSVFMAAWKVHIQSGDYSFYFQHRRDDSGIGMIRPIWQDPTEDLPPNLTRMTLLLHEDGDPEYLSTQRETIRRQLRDLKGDILLFMRNLQEIRVSFFDEVHGSETTTIFSAAETGPNRVTVTKRVTGDWAKTKSTASVYHVTKYRAWNLAKNENRTYSKVEEETKAYSTADVVLAFPLTPDSVPIMQPQNVFAFLPFLIQSDFVTQASRQDIVTTSARNIGLLDGISDAFIQAMLQFCEHPKLQYTWMRFVPLADHYPFDSFWSRLVTKIREKVQTTPLVRPRSEGSLRLIKELQQPTAKYFDRHGDLLLRDWTPEVCTSRHYGDGDIGILRILGMENSFLQWFFLMQIYFAETQGLEIPPDLQFSLVKSSAAANPHRRELFRLLGVQHLDIDSVRARIFERHRFYASDQRGLLVATFCSRFLRGNENFPFLQLEESIERSTYTDPWGPVANCLGLGVEDDLDFYLKILQTVARAEAEEVEDVPRIFELYNVIYGKYLQSADKSVFKKKIRSLFDTTFMIYAPYDNEGPAWIVPKFCLWEGPKIMKTKFVLEWQFEKAIAEGTTELIGLSPFFTEVLEIPDCNCFHIIEEFRDLRDDPDEEIASRVGDLYTRLNDMVGELSIADQERIKQNFSDENLIYAKSGSGSNWHKPSDCIWSSETDLNGTVTLTEHYEDLKGFFVDFVGVKTLTMDMVYQELIRLGSSPEATVKLVKSNLWVLNSFISTSDRLPDTKQLLRRKVFPVRDPGGQVSLQSLATDFIIVDRTHLGDIFRPRVRALDFPFDEVRRLAPTLGWLGMETRYLSRMVKEHSRVDGAGRNPLSSPQRRITPKAYALYRIAYHFNSPRLQAGGDVFETLKTAHVYETDGIASTLCISQDGREFSHEQSRSDLHIEDRDDKLEIFVPRAKKSQELCYARRLPLQLFEWLMTHPTTRIVDKLDEKGLRITQSVLNTSRSLLPDILEGEGIALADLEDDYSGGDDGSDSEVDRATDDDELETPTLVDTEPDVETSAWSTPASSQFPSSPNRGTPPARMASSDRFGGAASAPRASASQRPTQNIPSGSHVHRDTSYTHATSRLGASSRSTTSRPAPVSPSPVDYETRQYRDLLNRVVRAARAAAFPSRGSFDMAGMSEALPILDDYNYHDGLDQYPRFRSSSQLERDKKIGAAGELYVFELLKNLAPALPGFSLENWRSTIRKYVSVHADYAHIEAWNGRETADLVYNDSDGILTELLIENGYLDEEAWRSRMPNYLLEVKATTGPCNTPFYMSKHQYQRMHDHRDDADTIYVIFRVFDVNNSVQLRVYVNPPELEDLGQLVFTAETWSVTPGIPR
ncbi:hypothetical protein ACJ41O_009365 [Fusarium nematophilum]